MTTTSTTSTYPDDAAIQATAEHLIRVTYSGHRRFGTRPDRVWFGISVFGALAAIPLAFEVFPEANIWTVLIWMALGLLVGCLVGLVVSNFIYENLRSRYLALKAAEPEIAQAAMVAVQRADVERMVQH